MGLKAQHPQLDQTEDAINSPPAASVSDDHHQSHSHSHSHSHSQQAQGPTTPTRVSSCCSTDDSDSGLPLCRVCHCVEPDLRGESALGFLGIAPPPPPSPRTDTDSSTTRTTGPPPKEKDDGAPSSRFVQFVSPEGEIFVCAADVESGPLHQQDHLVDLGCSCKNDLALAHYACALKWFISHGSTACEICGTVAANVRPEDFNRVLASLKDYEALRERTSTGEISYFQPGDGADAGVDPDAVAAIRRQRLSEISSWFNPHSNSNVAVSVSQGHIDQPQPPQLSPTANSVLEHSVVAATRVHTRWSLENTGVFVAICLVVIILAWLVAPHVGKKAAVICLHMLLGGLCVLTVVISLRFVFPRIQYGSMQYWAILFVSWFLVFGVWASRTRSARSS